MNPFSNPTFLSKMLKSYLFDINRLKNFSDEELKNFQDKQFKKIVDFAREKGIQNIEGELGYLRGGSDIHETIEIKEEDLTNPEQADDFIEKTGIDSLAIVIGNIHGIFKSSRSCAKIYIDFFRS